MKKIIFLILITPLFLACSSSEDDDYFNPVEGEWAYWTIYTDPGNNDVADIIFTKDFKTNVPHGSTFFSYTVDTKRIYFESTGAGFFGYRIYKEDGITFMMLHGEGLDDNNCPGCASKLYKIR